MNVPVSECESAHITDSFEQSSGSSYNAQVCQLVQEAGLSEQEAREILNEATTAPETSLAASSSEDSPPPPGSWEANQQFLAAAFPHVALGSRNARLREANNDLERATDLLLNLAVLDEVREGSPQFFDRGLKRASKNKRRKQRRRSKSNKDHEDALDTLCHVLGVNRMVALELYEGSDQSLTRAIAAGTSPREKARAASILERLSLSPSGNPTVPLKTPAVTKPSVGASQGPLTGSTRELEQELLDTYREIELHSERAKKYARSQGASRTLSTESWALVREAQEHARQLAIAIQLRQGNYHTASNKIDLHGLTAEAAELATAQALHKFVTVGKSDTFEIVTGAGLHSKNSKPVLKNAIRALLNAEGFSFQEHEGSFTVERIS